MRIVRLSLALIATVTMVYLGAFEVGPLPAFGAFLDPVRGVWSVAVEAAPPGNARITVDGLADSVVVEYDDRGVPHIYATSPEDAAWALGYVVARDRLFQLELQTRATAGTLTEILGADALGTDRFQRRLGLAWSADHEWASLDKDLPAAALVTAYARGVNARIDALGPREIPFEYHLLGVRPQRWEPVHSLYLTRRMGYTLSYSTIELWRDQVVSRVGERAADALFPVHSPIQEPVQPGGRRSYPWFDMSPLPPPSPTSTAGTAVSGVALSSIIEGERHSVDKFSGIAGIGSFGPDIGSNNWVVGPARSSTGYPILAGDPHLDLTLPSIWYEVHVKVEGQFDVYGVTIPGAPGVLIGFNRDVAWSFTNVGADALDYFREELDSPVQPARYRLDGAWEPLERRIEVYRDESGKVLAVDSVYHTHRGPIRIVDDVPYSLRWTNHDPYAVQTTAAFDGAGRATSIDEIAEAFREYYPSSQNQVMADRQGNIAIRSTGLFPIRDDGGGVRARDGRLSASDWRGQWPVETYPAAKNPEQGFLASANQQPLDPFDNAAYLGVNWPSPWRAMRINRLLREDSSVTPEDMRRFQTDPGNERAELFVDLILGTLRRESGGPALELFEGWDRRYTFDDTVAILFESVIDAIENRVWDDLVRDTSGLRRVATPGEQVLWRVLRDSNSPWCDARWSEPVETCGQIVAQALEGAYAELVERLGPPGDAWRWDRHRFQNIHHMLGLVPMSALRIPVQGGPGNLNPSSGRGTHGASWRMVVELGPEVRARVIYPGGQSGNPLSEWYDDRIDEWARGELVDALYPSTAGELGARLVSTVVVLPGGDF